jgi:hypothetical protein
MFGAVFNSPFLLEGRRLFLPHFIQSNSYFTKKLPELLFLSLLLPIFAVSYIQTRHCWCFDVRDDMYGKAFAKRFDFDILRISQIRTVRQRIKATVDAPSDVYTLCIYHSAWGVGVARFDEQGNARAFRMWSERKATAPRFFLYMPEGTRITNHC